jgi:hypothetical protein
MAEVINAVFVNDVFKPLEKIEMKEPSVPQSLSQKQLIAGLFVFRS